MIGAATLATKERDDAVGRVRQSKSGLMRIARRVFRQAPEQLRKLGF